MAFQPSTNPNDPTALRPNRYSERREPQFIGGNVDTSSGNLIPGTRQDAASSAAAPPAPPEPAQPTTRLAGITADKPSTTDKLLDAATSIGTGLAVSSLSRNLGGSSGGTSSGTNAGGFSTGVGSGGSSSQAQGSGSDWANQSWLSGGSSPTPSAPSAPDFAPSASSPIPTYVDTTSYYTPPSVGGGGYDDNLGGGYGGGWGGWGGFGGFGGF